MKDTNNAADTSTLLPTFLALLQRQKSVCSQERVFNRVTALALAEIFAFGRHTVTQLLLTLGLDDADHSAWYRLFTNGRWKAEAASRKLTQEALTLWPKTGPVVAAMDAFPVPRTSQKMPGTGWGKAAGTAPFRPGLRRLQRFSNGALLTPLENGYSRAIPVHCQPIFTPKAVESAVEPRKEWEGGLAYMQWLRHRMDVHGRHKQGLVALADGAYNTVGLLQELPERVSLVVRARRDQALYELPPPRTGEPGRPRLYGAKAPPPHTWVNVKQRRRMQRTTIVVRGRERAMRYRVCGPYLRDGAPDTPVFLLAVGGGKRPPGSRRQRYVPNYFLVTAVKGESGYALPLPVKALLVWLWQRWEVEVCHREMKTGFGLGQKQAWHRLGTITAVQWNSWVYGLMLVAALQTWGVCGGPAPPGAWRKPAHRWSFNTLSRAFRRSMWQVHEFRACWFPSADNWPKKEGWLLALNNAILGAQHG